MQTIGISRLPEFIDFNVNELDNAAFIWGDMGMAKTKLIGAEAKRHAAHLVPLHVSSYESVDFRGLPDRDGNMTKWLMPETIPFKGNPKFDHISELERIWLYLDEMNANIMAMMYQLVDERRVNEHELRDNVRIIASGNREGDRGITMRMPLPLANRLVHVEVMPELDFLLQHFASINIDPVIIAYLAFKKAEGEHYQTNRSRDDKVVATWRTWEKAARAFAARDKAKEVIVRATMAGCVGEGSTSGVWAYYKVFQHVKTMVPDILAGKKVPPPAAHDMRYAITVALSGEMSGNKQKEGEHICEFLKQLEPSFEVLAWSLATKRDDSVYTLKGFMDYSQRYKEIFEPTGG